MLFLFAGLAFKISACFKSGAGRIRVPDPDHGLPCRGFRGRFALLIRLLSLRFRSNGGMDVIAGYLFPDHPYGNLCALPRATSSASSPTPELRTPVIC